MSQIGPVNPDVTALGGTDMVSRQGIPQRASQSLSRLSRATDGLPKFRSRLLCV